jgi:8-oxo-dGTP diphosphatase
MKKRRHGAGKWNGVGGKIEPGETPIQAAVRECQEEINVTPRHLTQKGILHFTQQPYVDNYSNIDTYVFVCTTWDGTPTETEEMAPRWYAHADVPYESMWPDDVFWLPGLLAGRNFEGWFTFDNTYNLIKHQLKVAL